MDDPGKTVFTYSSGTQPTVADFIKMLTTVCSETNFIYIRPQQQHHHAFSAFRFGHIFTKTQFEDMRETRLANGPTTDPKPNPWEPRDVYRHFGFPEHRIPDDADPITPQT